jgi:hypothetical protein
MDDSQFILAVSKRTLEYAHSGSSLQQMKITKAESKVEPYSLGCRIRAESMDYLLQINKK